MVTGYENSLKLFNNPHRCARAFSLNSAVFLAFESELLDMVGAPYHFVNAYDYFIEADLRMNSLKRFLSLYRDVIARAYYMRGEEEEAKTITTKSVKEMVDLHIELRSLCTRGHDWTSARWDDIGLNVIDEVMHLALVDESELERGATRADPTKLVWQSTNRSLTCSLPPTSMSTRLYLAHRVTRSMYKDFVVPKPDDDEQTLVAKALGRQSLGVSYIGSRRTTAGIRAVRAPPIANAKPRRYPYHMDWAMGRMKHFWHHYWPVEESL